MIVQEPDARSLLVKNTSSTTYDMLIKKAVKEGRVGGAHRCPICGMRSHTAAEADACCERVREKF
jgi:hypothetical protein